jgi:hypothetical protein
MYRAANSQKYRPFDYFVKNRFDYPLVGVEVGVWRGEHAKQMLQLLKLKHLFLVDSYLPFTEGDIVYSQSMVEDNLTTAQLNVAGYSQTQFCKMLSKDAAKLISKGLDFVYIDATHTYNSVLSDLDAWFPLVKKGGVFGGHDFTSEFQSVVRAVFDFAKDNNLHVYFQSPDWWIIKGEVNEGMFS